MQTIGIESKRDQVAVVGLTVRFVGGPPSDEVVRAAHRLVKRAGLPAPLTLTVRWSQPSARVSEMRLFMASCGELKAAGPAWLPALHRLCDHASSLLRAPESDRARFRAARAALKESGIYPAINKLGLLP